MSHEYILERIYTIPLYPKLNSIPRTKRAPRAVRLVKEFVERHMKSDDILIDSSVNEYLWSRGIQKPPRKISVRVKKADDDIVEVYLVGAEVDEVFKPEVSEGPSLPSETDIESEEEFEEESED
jgi:large subunit ribosomal protein L31e